MFHAHVQGGKLSLGPINKRKFQEWLAAHEGKTVSIDIVKPVRPGQQNRYYWLYLGVIERETGENADDLHEFFKRKFLPPVFKTIQGEEIKLPASTTELSKNDFGEYLDKICALTSVPLPDPEAAGFLPH